MAGWDCLFYSILFDDDDEDDEQKQLDQQSHLLTAMLLATILVLYDCTNTTTSLVVTKHGCLLWSCRSQNPFQDWTLGLHCIALHCRWRDLFARREGRNIGSNQELRMSCHTGMSCHYRVRRYQHRSSNRGNDRMHIWRCSFLKSEYPFFTNKESRVSRSK